MKDMFNAHKKVILIVVAVALVLVGGIAFAVNAAQTKEREQAAAAASSSEAAASSAKAKAATEIPTPNTGDKKKDAMIIALNKKLADEFKIRMEYNAKGGKDFEWASYISKVEYYKGKMSGVKIHLNEAGSKLSKDKLFEITEHAHTFAAAAFYNVAGTSSKEFSEDDVEEFFDMTNRQKELYAVVVNAEGKTLYETTGSTRTFDEEQFKK